MLIGNNEMGGGAGVVKDGAQCESNSRYIQMMNLLDRRDYQVVFDVIKDAVMHPKTAYLFDEDFRNKYSHFQKDFKAKGDVAEYHKFIYEVVKPFWQKIYDEGSCQLDDTYFTAFDTTSLN
jgi:hypothetical protein